jgi:hypothetical protein
MYNALCLVSLSSCRLMANFEIRFIYYYLFLKAISLTPGGSSTVHIYTQTVHRLTPGGSSTVHIYTQTVHRLTHVYNSESKGLMN